jgi:hypothetical protein
VLVVLLLALGVLAGCGVSSDDKPSGASSDSASPEPTESVTPTESDSATPTETATQSPTSAPSPTLAPQAALLTAQEMPSLNDTQQWKQGRTGPIGSRPFGLCAKFDLLSIGAEQAVERRFTSAGGGTAGQQIATFPDAANAARANKVIQAWHRSCATRVPGTSVRVDPISAVPVASGTGWWYIVSYVRNGEGHFHELGVVLSGTRMSLVRIDHGGQDHNYPPGQDPMQLAVKAAAGKLG